MLKANETKTPSKAGKVLPTREDSVASAAYFLAEKRGFEPGGELQDWLAAENMVMVSDKQVG